MRDIIKKESKECFPAQSRLTKDDYFIMCQDVGTETNLLTANSHK